MSDLLSLTIKRNILQEQIPVNVSQINLSKNDVATVNIEASVGELTNVSRVNLSDTATLNGRDVDLFGVVSDERLEEIYSTTVNNNKSNPVKYSTTYKNLSFTEISRIKKLIFEMHNNQVEDGDFTLPEIPPDKPDEPDIPEFEEEDVPKKSFITDFADTKTMFAYLNKVNPAISYETGITRSQLVALTQDDDWEDSNRDFFGTLNRIFDALDKDDDSVLIAGEIEDFVGKELGEDYNEYIKKVNNYADQLQTEYENLSDQEKLEFVIERTREYLEAAGLTKQLNALERLEKEEDMYNTVKVGQIAMTEFEDDAILGAYTSACFQGTYGRLGDDTRYNTSYFASDNDDADFDRGITLNIKLLELEWYELVNTLVHELTHATAYSYYPDPSHVAAPTGGYYLNYNISQLEFIKDYLSDVDYQYYQAHFENIVNSGLSYLLPSGKGDALSYFEYLLSCQWGEYAAYQADADYVDSIGGDLLIDTYGNNIFSTAADGSEEKTVIENHIDEIYNTAGMTIEDYALYNDFDISDINDADGDGVVSYGDTVNVDGKAVDIYEKEAKPDYTWWSYDGTLA